MNISKKTLLIILGITALTLSRVMFSLFNDPEGPNLLVVIGMASIIYVLSFAAYVYYPSASQDSLKKLLLLILAQLLVVTGFYFFLK